MISSHDIELVAASGEVNDTTILTVAAWMARRLLNTDQASEAAHEKRPFPPIDETSR